MTSEVMSSAIFRPAAGDLLVRDFLSNGVAVSADSFKKDELRPRTQSGYRFGQLSHHSFFTRHNPHPFRVKHMKGLLDVPICCVNDEGYIASPRYSLQFPPNGYNSKLKNWKGLVPASSINFNRHLQSINSIPGFQFLPDLTNFRFREKAVPGIGLVPITETWRDELAAFTKSLELDRGGKQARFPATLAQHGVKPPKTPAKTGLESRPRTTVYSQETGRIIPPPSRAVSRGQSGGGAGKLSPEARNFQNIMSQLDWENLVLRTLCQLFQTDDVYAVQSWLCSAGETEKAMVMSLVRTALEGLADQPHLGTLSGSGTPRLLPPIPEKSGSSDGEVNRLVLEGNTTHAKPTEDKTFQDASVSTEDDLSTTGDISYVVTVGNKLVPPDDQTARVPSPSLQQQTETLQSINQGNSATIQNSNQAPTPYSTKIKPRKICQSKNEAVWCPDQSISR